ncbi:unnamed protein product [Trichobilharzia regenti]|nr:unnamed protein product [Trichobilharzia regenti]
MRAVAKCFESELDKRKSAQESFSYALTNLSDWLNEAERLLILDTNLELEKELANTEIIQDKLSEHEAFLSRTQTTGQTCLIELNRTYDKMVELFTGNTEDLMENSATSTIHPDDVSMNVILEASNQVTRYRDRFDVSDFASFNLVY